MTHPHAQSRHQQPISDIPRGDADIGLLGGMNY